MLLNYIPQSKIQKGKKKQEDHKKPISLPPYKHVKF